MDRAKIEGYLVNNETERLGKWISTDRMEEWYTQEFRCSLCGGFMLGQFNYCPHCGAKMQIDKEWLGNGSS